MDAKLAFWTWALANMVTAIGCAALGVRKARRQEIRAHRRLMLSSMGLVVLFLVAYIAKATVLGREDVGSWTPSAVWVLRIHETFVAAMLLGGAVAGWIAFRTPPPRLAFQSAAARRRHRTAGWFAVGAGTAGLALAVVVWAQMVARA